MKLDLGCSRIDWKDIIMMLNGNEINLPSSVVIPLRDKIRARKLLRRQPLFFHVMLKQEKHGLPYNIIIETLTLLTSVLKK